MWCDYAKATMEQQADFRRANPQIAPNYVNYQLWVTKAGRTSKSKGRWQWTAKYAADQNNRMNQIMRGEDVRSKGDLRAFKAGDLHLNKEPL